MKENQELTEIIVPKFFDAHAHLREKDIQNNILWIVLKEMVKYCFGAVVMPNLSRPVCNIEDVGFYSNNIKENLKWINSRYSSSEFQTVMTIQLTDIEKKYLCKATTPEIILKAHQGGVKAGKAYPVGATTNSARGIKNFRSQAMKMVWKTMEDLGMRALLHPEQPGVFCMDKEKKFFDTVRWLVDKYPKLKIVLEHITSAEAVNFVKQLPDTVKATITAHHLILTLDDIIGGKLHPHNFCHPIPKRPKDRDALIQAAISGNPKFFFGSDRAPHLKKNKECATGSAGVYSGPVVPSILAKIFADNYAIDKLKDFTSTFASDFYDITPSTKTIKIVKEPWRVPKMYDEIVPFLADQTLDWRLAD
ncbi:dihydroorotase [Patescibacteria group bacterium]